MTDIEKKAREIVADISDGDCKAFPSHESWERAVKMIAIAIRKEREALTPRVDEDAAISDEELLDAWVHYAIENNLGLANEMEIGFKAGFRACEKLRVEGEVR